MDAVKQIHNDFYCELVAETSEEQKVALSKIGFSGVAPKEYREKFPLHKIIHKNRILKLCEKYDLLYGPVESYVGGIPQKSIAEIEKFINSYPYFHFFKNGIFKNREDLFKRDSSFYEKYDKAESFDFRIVAPKEMMAAKESSNMIISVPDPMIFAMIREEHKYTYYESNLNWGIIITAWGPEANDEEIVNEKMN